MSWVKPFSLQGQHVKLIPLSIDHCDELIEVTKDGELWKLWYTSAPSPDDVTQYVKKALDKQQKGEQMPFVVQEIHNGVVGKVVGTTRLYDVDPENRRLDIGYTWYKQSVQRTAVNTECKLLLLEHCFETLKCIAVEFCTHFMNHKSRNAILRLGAKQDGILRNHMIMNGLYRDSVVFSIIESEWPAVKMNLQGKLTIT